MTVGSLFAGIGGFDLGLERAGFEIRWQVEIDPFCRAVLAKHWPLVRRYDDVRTVGSELESVDLVCGGFPCQPHSHIGGRKGADDDRDLWPQFARIIRELRPRWVLAENVPGILSSDTGRFVGGILRDLATCGYDAEWDCLPASAFGALHQRDRLWIVAYARRERLEGQQQAGTATGSTGRSGGSVARLDFMPVLRELPLHDSHDTCVRVRVPFNRRLVERPLFGSGVWETGPPIFRMASGVPHRMDRLRSLGNAIVPQVAEWLGRRILAAEEMNDARGQGILTARTAV